MRKHELFSMVLLFVFTMAPNSSHAAERYKGFTRLNPNSCSNADAAVISRLSPDWQKYSGFVKVCGLRKDKKPAEVSIISIWVDDYFKIKYPPPAVPQWEQFPLPLIVDKHLAKIGSLPEIFPDNDVTSPIVYYGKWYGGIPTEIRVDVQNPAVGGDYYYPPIQYDESERKYGPVTKEMRYGRRK